MKIFLIHGGLWEPMTAQRFWREPGIVDALTGAGHTCIAPDRPPLPRTWRDDTDHLTPHLPDAPFAIIAASNGSTPAVEIATACADRVTGLLLAWPATQGDPTVDAYYRRTMRDQGATDDVIDRFLAGQTLRGLTDDRISRISDIPQAFVPAPPASPTHQRHTVDALARLARQATILPTFPEAPRPEFPPVRDDFITTVTDWLAGLNRPDERHRP